MLSSVQLPPRLPACIAATVSAVPAIQPYFLDLTTDKKSYPSHCRGRKTALGRPRFRITAIESIRRSAGDTGRAVVWDTQLGATIGRDSERARDALKLKLAAYRPKALDDAVRWMSGGRESIQATSVPTSATRQLPANLTPPGKNRFERCDSFSERRHGRHRRFVSEPALQRDPMRWNPTKFCKCRLVC